MVSLSDRTFPPSANLFQGKKISDVLGNSKSRVNKVQYQVVRGVMWLMLGKIGVIQCFCGIIWPSKRGATKVHALPHAAEQVPAGWGRERTYISDRLIECFESWLLLVMVDTSIPMQDRYTFPLGLSAIASIHAVIRTVVPLAGEHVETLWGQQEKDTISASDETNISINCTPQGVSKHVSHLWLIAQVLPCLLIVWVQELKDHALVMLETLPQREGWYSILDKKSNNGSRQLETESQLCGSKTVQPRSSDLIALCFSFLIHSWM